MGGQESVNKMRWDILAVRGGADGAGRSCDTMHALLQSERNGYRRVRFQLSLESASSETLLVHVRITVAPLKTSKTTNQQTVDDRTATKTKPQRHQQTNRVNMENIISYDTIR